MKKTLFTVLCTLFFTLNLCAQHTDAMLSGDVKDIKTGVHLPFASVKVKGTNLKTIADATGHFTLADLPVGKNQVVASLLGYKDKIMTVDMKAGKTSTLYFQLESDEMNLDQVVVTATRTEHYIKNVPIRTEVLTSDALVKKNANNVYEALEGVPGIRVEQQCQFCNFSMVRMQGLGAEHTQVLVDGQPIYSGLASVYGLQQMGTFDLDRIEIVKGSGSAFFGSSAVAGAINLISKEPTFVPCVKADLQMGNYGHKIYNASASMRNQKYGLNIFAQRMQEDDIDETGEGIGAKEVFKKDGVSDRVNTKVSNLGFDLYLYSPFAQNDKLVIRGKGISEDRYGGTITDNQYLNPFSEGTESINTNRLSADLAYTLPIGKASELSLTLAYVHHRRKATNDTFLGDYKDSHKDANPTSDLLQPYIATENTITPTLTFGSQLGTNNILFGVQGYFSRFKETGKYCIADDESNPYYGVDYLSIGHKHANEFGLFAQDEWNILPNLSVVPGVRVDFHNSGENYTSDKKVFDKNFPETKFNETSVNPRLAIKYEVTPNIVLRANVGTGFRAPYGFSEDLHLCSGSPRVWKSSGLKGEKSLSFNLSGDYYAKNLVLSANIFRTNLKNKIEFGTADDKVKSLGYTYQWENVDNAYVQGLELGVKWKPFKDFSTVLNWTFNQGEYDHERADWVDRLEQVKEVDKNQVATFEKYLKDSKNISRFPAMTGDLTLEYTPGTWSFALIGQLQGKMYIDYNAEVGDDNENLLASKIKTTPTFTTWNLRVSKKLGRNFMVYAGGKNIFSYKQDEKHLDDAAFMYAPVYGCTWYAGVKVDL